MNKRTFTSSILVISIALLAACETSPLGRQQLRLLPEDQVTEMGVTAYEQIKRKTPIVRDRGAVNYVNCIADAITRQVSQDDWEVNIFEDKAANAFALPGGKIGVNTGMLNLAENQNQLAAVIAHEVAHVTTRHANERISNQFATQTGTQLIGALLGGGQGGQAITSLLGAGAQYGILLPYGRAQESEADLIGLDLMARAGFDPRASIDLWQNMARANRGAPPEFLSTHPSGTTRIGDLNNRMPQALQLYDRAQASGARPNCGR